MKNKLIIGLSMAICMGISFTGCESSKDEASQVQENTKETTSESLTVAAVDNKLTAETIAEQPSEKATVKVYPHSDKAFLLEDYLITLQMVNGWEIDSGGSATDSQADQITSYPAVIKYLDTKNVIKINADDNIKDKETFLAYTEDNYKEDYKSEFESINITDFQQTSIDEYDSFKVVADVVIDGEKYQMTHIISNNVNEKDMSFMMLDNDGSLEDFDLVGALSYPQNAVVDIGDIGDRLGLSDEEKEMMERARKGDFKGMYGWDNEKQEAVKIE